MLNAERGTHKAFLRQPSTLPAGRQASTVNRFTQNAGYSRDSQWLRGLPGNFNGEDCNGYHYQTC